MEEMTRRNFMGAMGAMGAAAVFAAEARADEGEKNLVAAPDASLAVGAEMADMTDEEALARLLDEPVITLDYVQPDGKVIPAVYLMLRNRLNRYGMGLGSEGVGQGHWDWLMQVFSPEDAKHWLEMPMYKFFTADEYAGVSGRTETECLEICEDLASRGLLYRARRGGVPFFHLIAKAHGILEYTMKSYDTAYVTPEEATAYCNGQSAMGGSENLITNWDCGTPLYRILPVDEELVTGSGILPYDSWKDIVNRNAVVAVSPCQCRLVFQARGTLDCPHPLETCLSFGEEAEYYIENGIGRQITQQEAYDLLSRNIEELGLVPECMWTKGGNIICSCHRDCCGQLGVVYALGAERMGDSFDRYRHYNLVHDADACIKCGACVERCPMAAVTMGEDGTPELGPLCVGCGQCSLVCPVSARWLETRPSDEIAPLPDEMFEDYKQKAIVRMKKGYVTDFLG